MLINPKKYISTLLKCVKQTFSLKNLLNSKRTNGSFERLFFTGGKFRSINYIALICIKITQRWNYIKDKHIYCTKMEHFGDFYPK